MRATTWLCGKNFTILWKRIGSLRTFPRPGRSSSKTLVSALTYLVSLD